MEDKTILDDEPQKLPSVGLTQIKLDDMYIRMMLIPFEIDGHEFKTMLSYDTAENGTAATTQ